MISNASGPVNTAASIQGSNQGIHKAALLSCGQNRNIPTAQSVSCSQNIVHVNDFSPSPGTACVPPKVGVGMKGVECEAILKIRHCELPKVARQSAFIPLSTQTEKTHTLHPLPSPQMKGLERARREFRLTISVAQVIHFSPSPGERARVEVPPKVGLLACRRLGQEVTAPTLRACPRSAANGLVFRTRNSRRTYHSISGSLSLGFGDFAGGPFLLPAPHSPKNAKEVY